jgi:hypothetical protein
MKTGRVLQRWIPVAFALAPAFAEAALFDFDSAALQSIPAGWLVAMTHDGGPPRWEIARDDPARAEERILAQLSDDRTAQRFPLAILMTETFVDGDVSVRFKTISGRVDQAAGLVWRYRDKDNYYVVRANALEDNVVLYKVENGERVALAPLGKEGQYGEGHDVPAGEWHTLGVVFRRTRFRVLFDGTELYEVEDATFSDQGRVGLWTKADSVTYFDDFEVSAAEE